MFKNYLKIAYRNILKDKYYSIISFVGLSIGISFFGLMLIFLNHELSYDTSYTDSDQIYRTILISSGSDTPGNSTAQLPLPFSEIVTSEIEGIESVSRVFGVPQQIIETEHTRGRLDDMVSADASFLKIFDLNFEYGDQTNPLSNQMSIVLTKETAQRFFGNESPIGKTMDIEAYGLFTVTAVLDDIPKNSSFRFSAIMNANVDQYLDNFTGPAWFRNYYTSWQGRVAHTYIKLEENANPYYIATQLGAITNNYFSNPDINRSFSLQPISDVHFKSSGIQSNITELNGTPGNLQYVFIFAAISILILLIACINYMNLSSARSIKRTYEIGLRSVFGAKKDQLVFLFLTQSVVMTFIAIPPSLGLIQIMIPYFELFTGIELALSLPDLLRLAILSFPSLFVIGVLSGLFPAFMLLKKQLSNTVKQKSSGSVHSSLFRKSLVVSQFTLTYVIVVITLIAGKQLTYLFDKDLGFAREHVVVIEINDGRLRQFIPDLKQQISNNPNVIGIAGLSRMVSGYREPEIIEVSTITSVDELLPVTFYGFDEDVIPVMELEILRGRNFIKENAETLNANSVLINESAAKVLFNTSSPINQSILLGADEQFEATIDGVVKDFHYQSLHENIQPLVIGYIDNPFVGIDDFAIRLTGTDISNTIAEIEQVIGQFIELDEEAGLEYEFLDSMIGAYYKTDTIYKKLFFIGSLITILLAVVGLIGLTTFYAEMRTKEFGIRKVLGASLKDLITIQSSFFSGLILISIFIGAPFAYLVSWKWLQNFSYHTDFGLGLFAVAAICILVVALLPIGIIAFKTAKQNPISQLRTE